MTDHDAAMEWKPNLYMEGIRDGRASLRDVLVETLEHRGVVCPQGHDTDPADLVTLVARALDASRAECAEMKDVLALVGEMLERVGANCDTPACWSIGERDRAREVVQQLLSKVSP